MTGDKKDKMPQCIIKMEAPKLMGKMVADDARFLLYPWTWMVSADVNVQIVIMFGSYYCHAACGCPH